MALITASFPRTVRMCEVYFYRSVILYLREFCKLASIIASNCLKHLTEFSTIVNEILKYNKEFVANKGYEKFITNKYPDKKIAILSCMDTRLTELLPAALGIKNGDVKMIKNAGGIISHPFGSVIRSLLVAIFELGVTDVMVVAHSDCGACHMSAQQMIEHMKARGIHQDKIDMIRYCGVDFEKWLYGFGDTEKSVRETVEAIVNHPLIPHDIQVHGFIIDSHTGELTRVDC